eukprot:Lithocolla_globosa_v1_NODE_2216_length_2105_cov_24.194634.p1 type:complete len:242 gc:universal NODE_2216_length_2105_cov_24.194634:734-1459(+)
MNGALTENVSGTHQVVAKMLYGALMMRNVKSVISAFPVGRLSMRAIQLLERLGCKGEAVSSNTCVAVPGKSHMFFLGNEYLYDLPVEYRNKLYEKIGFFPENVKNFLRLRIKDSILHSQHYSKATKSNSFTVSFIDNQGQKQFGVVQFYCLCQNSSGQDVTVAFIHRLILLEANLIDLTNFDGLFSDVTLLNNVFHQCYFAHERHLECISIEQIRSVCILSDGDYTATVIELLDKHHLESI